MRSRLSRLLAAPLVLVWFTAAFAEDADGGKPAAFELRLEAGRVSGQISNRPLSEVLERLSELQPFEYEGPSGLLQRRVNKVFTNLSVSDAIRRVLDGYDYYLLTDAEGAILELTVANLSGKPPRAARIPASGAPAAIQSADLPETSSIIGSPVPAVTAAPGVSLSEEERLSFEAAMHQEPPPELQHMFYPETPAEAVLSGPPPPPGFEPVDMPFTGPVEAPAPLDAVN